MIKSLKKFIVIGLIGFLLIPGISLAQFNFGLPSLKGNAGKVLEVDSNELNVIWATGGGGGGGTPAAPQYGVQYNNPLGTFAADSLFLRNPSDGSFSVSGALGTTDTATISLNPNILGAGVPGISLSYTDNVNNNGVFILGDLTAFGAPGIGHIFNVEDGTNVSQLFQIPSEYRIEVEDGTNTATFEATQAVIRYTDGTITTALQADGNVATLRYSDSTDSTFNIITANTTGILASTNTGDASITTTGGGNAVLKSSDGVNDTNINITPTSLTFNFDAENYKFPTARATTPGQVLTDVSANGNLTWENPGATGGVTSLNSLTGALSIAGGTNISVTPSGSNVTVAAPTPGSAGDIIFNDTVFGTKSTLNFTKATNKLTVDNIELWNGGNANSIAIGAGATTSSSQQFVVGSAATPINSFYLGGITAASGGSPVDTFIYSPANSTGIGSQIVIQPGDSGGTDIFGGDTYIRSGRGTSEGYSGDIWFEVYPATSGSGSSLNMVGRAIMGVEQFGVTNYMNQVTYGSHIDGVTVVDDADYTVKIGNEVIGSQLGDRTIAVINLTASRTITLPQLNTVGSDSLGMIVVIKDAQGAANTHNIVIAANGSETIDGATTYTLDTNYESVTLQAVYLSGAGGIISWMVI